MNDNAVRLRDNKIVRLIPVILLIGVSLFLHLYKISDIPRGIYIDEIAMAYDSWSLGHFGVERHLSSWPLYLNNCGGGQSVLYCYLDMPLLMLMGITPLAIRLPSIIFSMIACVCGWRVVARNHGYRAGILYLAIFTLVPYFTMAGRMGLDCNQMLGLCVLMIDLIDMAIHKNRKGLFVAAGIVGGITFYSYALSYLILPLFVVLLAVYLLWVRKITIGDILRLCIPMVILGAPLLVVQIINLCDLPELKIGAITFTKQIDYRANEVGFGHIGENIRGLYRCIFKTDISQFSNFENYSNLYPISLPIVIGGAVLSMITLVKNVMKREYSLASVVLLFTGCVAAVALLLDGILTYRINPIFFGLAYMIVLVLETIVNYKDKWCKCAVILVMVTYVLYFAAFAQYYFCVYPDDIYPQRLFGDDPTAAIEYVRSQDAEIADKPIAICDMNEAYLHYLAGGEISPYDYDLAKYGNIGTPELMFYEPDEYNTAKNYILYVPSDEEIADLESKGFTLTQMGSFVIAIAY